MKKQILFMMFLSLALIFAGVNKSFGQNDDALTTVPSCITPVTHTCFGAADALHPSVGVPYTYTITSTDYLNSGNETVHWFVVNNADLGANGIVAADQDTSHLHALIDKADGNGYLLSADGAYNDVEQTSDAVTLSWNYFDGQTEVVLLVAYVEDAINCTNNIEVYRIFPEFNFTLDVAGIDQDAGTTHMPTDDPANECVSPIFSASYAPGAADPASPGDGTVTVDYGQNYVYFMVNAANFTGAWHPIFDFAYDGAGTIQQAHWTYPNAATTAGTWNEIDISGGLTDVTSVAKIIGGGGAAAADGTAANVASDLTAVGTAGECIIVRVLVDHGTDAENVVLRTVTLTVDGIMYDPSAASGSEYANTGYADVGADTTGDGVCDAVDNDDSVGVQITPRPDINESDPTPFEQKTGEDQ
jgi:hypothetical protein